jgi:chromosome segregation ATPase
MSEVLPFTMANLVEFALAWKAYGTLAGLEARCAEREAKLVEQRAELAEGPSARAELASIKKQCGEEQAKYELMLAANKKLAATNDDLKASIARATAKHNEIQGSIVHLQGVKAPIEKQLAGLRKQLERPGPNA